MHGSNVRLATYGIAALPVELTERGGPSCLDGLDSIPEVPAAHVCIGRLLRPRGLFPLLGGSAVSDYELCLGITGIL